MSQSTRIDYIVKPGGPLLGRLQIPGDKSISHRALMFSAICEGDTHITGFLDSEDTIATMKALQAMGIRMDREGAGDLSVHGAGLNGLKAPAGVLYFGNSGTSVRLMAGILSGQEFDTELTGDDSLTRRPMRRITEPLQQMQADIECSAEGTLPIRIRGGRHLTGISYRMPVASAQLKSCLLLAGLYARGQTCVIEPAVTRDHTERMLAWFGCGIETTSDQICITPGKLAARNIDIPADISSAAFFMVAASIVEGSDLVLEKIGVNPTRNAVISILGRMGADISMENRRELSGEPVADIRIRHSELHGIHIPEELVPAAIDEFPVILVAAACARGKTVLSGASELRTKESDRIAAMEAGLKGIGIEVESRQDGMTVTGGFPVGGEVNSFTDHRIAMALAVAGLAASGPVTVQDCENVNTSFPGFVDLLQRVGPVIETRECENV